MISVAMTTYNGARYLKEQLDSILTQTEEDFELIICDDCSSDDTIKILSEYAKNDSRIHFFKNEENLGFTKNFEKVISKCNGNYIALSDQDDIWLPNHLSILLNFLKAGDYSLVGGNALLVDSDNNDFGCKFINNSNLPEKREDFEKMILYRNVFQGAALLFDKEILKKALPFPDNMKYHDWWLALIASEIKGIGYIDEPVLRYRQHGNNVTGMHEKDSFKSKIKKYFSFDLEETGLRNLNVLSKFESISNKKEKVRDALEFANACKNLTFRAFKYFKKHQKDIYYGESIFRRIIRSTKIFINVIIH